ncbi:uncharacterized protein TNCV_4673921 [Trichonephila clavipes]|nr:uncharacterized protein TNCV_4673921 [Trichonephila clavipes]
MVGTRSFTVLQSFNNASDFDRGNSPLIVTPHRTLNSCRGVISESDLLYASETEILEGLSDQGVTQNQNALTVLNRILLIPNIAPKWKTEKQIQEIKTNRNITYVEARKLIVPQTSHTYAQAAKSSNKTSSTQTDENITKIKCPPLELLQPLSSTTRTNVSISTPDVFTSSSSTQAQLLPSTSSISTSNSESQPPIPTWTLRGLAGRQERE